MTCFVDAFLLCLVVIICDDSRGSALEIQIDAFRGRSFDQKTTIFAISVMSMCVCCEFYVAQSVCNVVYTFYLFESLTSNSIE